MGGQRVGVVGFTAGVDPPFGLVTGVLGNGFWKTGAEVGLAAGAAGAEVGLVAGAAGADVAGARVPLLAGAGVRMIDGAEPGAPTAGAEVPVRAGAPLFAGAGATVPLGAVPREAGAGADDLTGGVGVGGS
jgi:hypothetical protein